MTGPPGSTLTTPEAVETMSSWMPYDSIIAPECVRIPGQLKLELLNGFQPVKLEKRFMQTRLWVSGAWMRSRMLIETAPTTRSASFAPKVHSNNKIESCHRDESHTLFEYNIFILFLFSQRHWCKYSGNLGSMVRLEPMSSSVWPDWHPVALQKLSVARYTLHWTQSRGKRMPWSTMS